MSAELALRVVEVKPDFSRSSFLGHFILSLNQSIWKVVKFPDVL